MSVESSLTRLLEQLSPPLGAEARVKHIVQQRIAPAMLHDAVRATSPRVGIQVVLWKNILSRIAESSYSPLFERIRAILTPAHELSVMLRSRVLARLGQYEALEEASIAASWSLRFVAVTALLALVVRLSSFIFLPPHSIAESAFLVIPQGQVYVLSGGLWQPLAQELALQKSALIQTQTGSATVIAHDDYYLRLAPHTTVALHDLSDRPAPTTGRVTLTLHTGNVWMLGLVPSSLQSISIESSQGTVFVNQGSVSVTEAADGAVNVAVWDRRATVTRGNESRLLLAGERIVLGAKGVPAVQKIESRQYEDSWVAGNFAMDEQHQREITQMQQERRAALAGILPTSPLYIAKRAAEAVDRALTVGTEARAQKQIAQAGTRFNEAAALLSAGNVQEASASLKEYRDTLVAVATSSGGDLAVQSLVQQELAEAGADTAAALPTDDGYALKQTVQETLSAVPGSVNAADARTTLVVDTLSAVKHQLAGGNDQQAEQTLKDLGPALSTLERTSSEAVRQEVSATLSTVATTLTASDGGSGGTKQAMLTVVESYLPRHTATVAVVHLTDEDIAALVARMYQRIFLYHNQLSRWNQLQVEFHSIDGHPDQGKILRALYHALPENGLARYVRTEWARVRERLVDEEKEQVIHRALRRAGAGRRSRF